MAFLGNPGWSDVSSESVELGLASAELRLPPLGNDRGAGKVLR
jgi:hypothetical protein